MRVLLFRDDWLAKAPYGTCITCPLSPAQWCFRCLLQQRVDDVALDGGGGWCLAAGAFAGCAPLMIEACVVHWLVNLGAFMVRGLTGAGFRGAGG